MKNILSNLIIVLAYTCATSCGNPQQKFSVTVVDENGAPMKGMECTAGFNRGKKSGMGLEPYGVKAITDSDGKAEIQGETLFFDSAIIAKKEGYYESAIDKMWIKGRNGDRWEPWPVEVKLVMKKIGSPHPMYAIRNKDGVSFKFPTPDGLGPVGFDLERKDWIEPYGKGKIADLIISGTLDDPSNPGYREENGRRIMSFAKGTIRVTFSNPDDGIQRFEDNGGSKLAGPAIAPLEGYTSSWEFANWNKEENAVSAAVECYVFRVRTMRDDKGEIISARYGKLDGRPRGSFGLSSFVDMIYYFNSGENDRRLEWDGETNLFKDLNRGNWPERN